MNKSMESDCSDIQYVSLYALKGNVSDQMAQEYQDIF